MRYIRFDPVGGASGDMIVAALVDLGVALPALNRAVRRCLPDAKPRLTQTAAEDRGLHGRRVRVLGAHEQPGVWPDVQPDVQPAPARATRRHAHGGRALPEILALLETPALDPATRRLARAVFERLAAAEGAIHGRPPDAVHFHEIGAADSIADIVAACLALRQLDVAGVAVGPLPCGVGTISCAHGVMPNPAPATMRLLAGLEVTMTDEPFELVTPTAAALFATWRALLPPPPARLRVLRDGIGIGHRQLRNRPNTLRATLLESGVAAADADEDADEELMVLETNLDDCNPQWLGAILPRLLAAGALDAWLTPITMKKGRPGVMLSALAPAAAVARLRDLIFDGTPTFGVRMYNVKRRALERRFESVATPFGAVRVKIGARAGRDLTRAPEYEDCARLAAAANVAPRAVFEAALRAVGAKPPRRKAGAAAPVRLHRRRAELILP